MTLSSLFNLALVIAASELVIIPIPVLPAVSDFRSDLYENWLELNMMSSSGLGDNQELVRQVRRDS